MHYLICEKYKICKRECYGNELETYNGFNIPDYFSNSCPKDGSVVKPVLLSKFQVKMAKRLGYIQQEKIRYIK